MAAQRCSVCAIDWPALVSYNTCPKCNGSTWRDGEAVGMTPEQGQYKRKEIQFDVFYAERGEKPLPAHMQYDVDVAVAGAEEQHRFELWIQQLFDPDP